MKVKLSNKQALEDIGQLEFYKREAQIQSDNVARLIEALTARNDELEDIKWSQKPSKKGNQFGIKWAEDQKQKALTKEINDLREGINYLKERALET